MLERLAVWLNNAKHFHERLICNYLKKHGWVVFYLDPRSRDCTDITFCWMKLYKQEEAKEKRKKEKK